MLRIVTLICALWICCGAPPATAFWWNSGEKSDSGLNVAEGYDVNTTATVQGTVVTPPARAEGHEQTVLVLAVSGGELQVILGPWWYWQRQNITLEPGQELTVTGSRAQGKDGRLYLFAQRLEVAGGGASLALRSESGIPLWSRAGGGAGAGAGGMPPGGMPRNFGPGPGGGRGGMGGRR